MQLQAPTASRSHPRPAARPPASSPLPPSKVPARAARAAASEAAPPLLSIKEVAALTSATTHTLRYYEREGLLRPLRAANGHRRYREQDVRAVIFWRRLHETGMPIRTMRAYARLLRRGESTSEERRVMLVDHRAEVLARIEVLQANLTKIDEKIRVYERLRQPALGD